MKVTTFRIRQRIIQAFLFCVLAILIFAGMSFQAHWEMGKRLRLVERADDLVNNILEIRRFEKNFFLYRQSASLKEARSYLKRVDEICCSKEEGILRLQTGPQSQRFHRILIQYQETLTLIETLLQKSSPGPDPSSLASLEENLRNLGQQLLTMSERWAKEERATIDRLFLRAVYLFVFSIVLFVILGVVVAWYISRLLVRPLFQMQTYMDKIAHGDFTPVPDSECKSQEFFSLFRAFNRMIQELEQHQEQLLQSGKIAAVGTLTAGIAHELNNPINNIVITAEALKEDFSTLDQEEAQDLIHDILVQSQRASDIVRNLLDFSRSEQPVSEPVNIVHILRDTLKLVQNQVTLSGVEVERELPSNLPIIHGNPKTLQQIFLNLFINAIQAMRDGGVLAVRAWTENGDHWLKVEVADTGPTPAPASSLRIYPTSSSPFTPPKRWAGARAWG
ncbi:MAG: HAMP domain-containing histidine kinase [Deltaproteobacteria bacterium]|nr:HAMP domain-containing histidine kinase [Deltaproteobacteria bacterium]